MTMRMRMEKLTKLEMEVMGMTVDGFMRGHRGFMRLDSEDDISDIIEPLTETIVRFSQGKPTLKDLCIAKISRTLPYTHFEALFEKKLWKAQVIAWEKLHAFEVHGRIIRGIRLLRSIIVEEDPAFLYQYLEFEPLFSYEDVSNKAAAQYYTKLACMLRKGE